MQLEGLWTEILDYCMQTLVFGTEYPYVVVQNTSPNLFLSDILRNKQ